MEFQKSGITGCFQDLTSHTEPGPSHLPTGIRILIKSNSLPKANILLFFQKQIWGQKPHGTEYNPTLEHLQAPSW